MHLAGQNARNLAQLNFDYHFQIQSFLELLDMVIDMQNRNPIFQYVYVGQHIRTFIFTSVSQFSGFYGQKYTTMIALGIS